MVFMNRQCGTKTVYCDGECDICILRMLKTPDGTQLYSGENKDGDDDDQA